MGLATGRSARALSSPLFSVPMFLSNLCPPLPARVRSVVRARVDGSETKAKFARERGKTGKREDDKQPLAGGLLACGELCHGHLTVALGPVALDLDLPDQFIFTQLGVLIAAELSRSIEIELGQILAGGQFLLR